VRGQSKIAVSLYSRMMDKRQEIEGWEMEKLPSEWGPLEWYPTFLYCDWRWVHDVNLVSILLKVPWQTSIYWTVLSLMYYSICSTSQLSIIMKRKFEWTKRKLRLLVTQKNYRFCSSMRCWLICSLYSISVRKSVGWLQIFFKTLNAARGERVLFKI
jgi:hypothetical protein